MAETLPQAEQQPPRYPDERIFKQRARAWEWDIVNDVLRLPAINNLRLKIGIGDFLKILNPEDKQNIIRKASAALYAKKAFRVPVRIRIPGSEERRLMVEGETLYDRQGKPIKMIGIFRKTPNNPVKEENADMDPPAFVGRWEWDAAKDTADWSDEVYRIYGLEPQRLVPDSASYLRYVHAEDRERVARAWADAADSGSVLRAYHRIIRADGKPRNVLLQGRPVTAEDGRITGLEGMLVDLTEKQEIERMTSGAQAVLRQVIDNAPIGIFWKDRDLRMIGCNRVFAALEGSTPEELVGKTNADTYSKARAREYNADDLLVMSTGNPKLGYEEKIDTPLGERILKTSKVPLFSDNGEIAGVLGVTEDITDLKESEAERHRLQDTEALARKQKEQVTDFFTNISHEFKTPLSIILIQLELMGMYMDDPGKMGELIAAAMQNTYRLTRLVGNLLDLTRIESGYMGVSMAKTEIVHVVRDICDSVGDFARAKAISLDFQTDSREISIQMDTDKLERILLNLLSNAIKHTPAGGAILVCLKREGDTVRMMVKDTGEGIPPDKLEMIFDRFSQVNSALANRSEGTGIGLSLVRSLVGLLGGKISVESKPGRGSTFTVELPAKEGEEKNQRVMLGGYDLHRKTAMELSDIYLE